MRIAIIMTLLAGFAAAQPAAELPIFPGARPIDETRQAADHRASVRLDGSTVTSLSAERYDAPARAEAVLSFYEAQLRRFGTVVRCSGGRNSSASISLDEKSLNLNACRSGEFGQGETELKAGTAANAYFVAVAEHEGHAVFTVVHATQLKPQSASR